VQRKIQVPPAVPRSIRNRIRGQVLHRTLPAAARFGNTGVVQRYREFTIEGVGPENNIPPVGAIVAYIDGQLRELTDQGGFVDLWDDRASLTSAITHAMFSDDGGHIAYGDQLDLSNIDDDKRRHTIVPESAIPALAAALADALFADGLTNLQARHIQAGGKNYQGRDISAALSFAVNGWVLEFGNAVTAQIRRVTAEAAQIWVGYRQDRRHDFQVSRLHWGIRIF